MTMKFLVKVNRAGVRGPYYVQRIDRTPIQMTSNPKHALMMGRFTAEDAVESMRSSRCNPELVSVAVGVSKSKRLRSAAPPVLAAQA
jgi:hypothetical protein